MSDYINSENNESLENNAPEVACTESMEVTVDHNNRVRAKKSGPNVSFAVVLCIVCVLLSVGSGLIGAYLVTGGGDVPYLGGGSGEIIVNKAVVQNDVVYDPTNHLTIPAVVTKVENSVVEITTEYKVMSSFYQYVTSGAGSGVIMSSDGYIITNNHVIMNSDNSKTADTITVRLKNGEEFMAVLVGRDEASDIAVIKIEANGLSAAVFGDSDNLVVGEEVIAVGNPLGSLGGSVTNGIISALDRKINVDGNNMNLLQTNADVNPGNSGGGLFDMHGNLVGIVNAKSTGDGIEGIGFAIPSNDAYDVFTQLVEFGYVRGKIYLGATFSNVTNSSVALYYFGSSATGVYVTAVEQGYNDNIKVGDRIIVVDGVEVVNTDDIKTALSDNSVGDVISVSVYRKGQIVELKLTCFEEIPDGIKQ